MIIEPSKANMGTQNVNKSSTPPACLSLQTHQPTQDSDSQCVWSLQAYRSAGDDWKTWNLDSEQEKQEGKGEVRKKIRATDTKHPVGVVLI